jgi:hypothetical protein
MNNISYKECEIIREKLNAALKPVMDELGLNFEIGRGTYSPNEFRAKLTIQTKWVELGSDFGGATPLHLIKAQTYDHDFLGKKFKVNNKTYTIVDINRRRWKRPVIGEASNGKRYVFQLSVLDKLL